MFNALGGCTLSNLTATQGTAITGLIPPRQRAFTRLMRIQYRCGSTAHTITALKALGSSTLTAAVLASGTSITLAADPGPTGNLIANSDWVAIQLDNGSYFLTTVSSLSSLTMTVNALPAAAAAGNKVFFFGVPGDHTSSQTNTKPNPKVGSQFPCTASVLNDWASEAGICQTLNQNEPIMVHSNNATAAGTFENVSAAHTSN